MNDDITNKAKEIIGRLAEHDESEHSYGIANNAEVCAISRGVVKLSGELNCAYSQSETNKELERLHRELNRTIGPMKKSKIFLSLLSEGAEKDPTVVMQLGLAVLLNKPIALLVEKNIKIPENLEKIAVTIERADLSDSKSLTKY